MRAAVKRLAAHIGGWFARNADGQQNLAVERALANRMVTIVGQPDRVVRGHMDTVRAHENALAPGPQEIAFAIKHAHRVPAAVEGVDVVVLVDPDRCDIGIEGPTFRQFGPVVDDLVSKAVRSQYYRHGASSSFSRGLGVSSEDYRKPPCRTIPISRLFDSRGAGSQILCCQT